MKKIIPWWLRLDAYIIGVIALTAFYVFAFNQITSIAPVKGSLIVVITAAILFVCGVHYFEIVWNSIRSKDYYQYQSIVFWVKCILGLCGLPILGSLPMALSEVGLINETVLRFGTLGLLYGFSNAAVFFAFALVHRIFTEDAQNWEGDVV